jgi:FlaA1/EpsC-like NDP-sugar epimerase
MRLLKFPISVIALEFLMVLTGTLAIRMVRRLYFETSEREKFESYGTNDKKKRTLLIGAGNAGNMVVKELKQRTDLGIEVVGFIDDDPRKFKNLIQGVKVIGNTSQITDLVRKFRIEEAIITIANASSKVIKGIADICEATKIKVKIVPGLFEMLDERVRITKIRDINIDDLLGRDVVNFKNHLPEVSKHYENKIILVTGAGGSIGSELCRQLGALWPKGLFLLDKDENSIFEIDNELCGRLGGQSHFNIFPLILDIRNRERLISIFERYKPQVIFHAAAYKHVPLMEYNASEAVLNNVLGTLNVVQLADRYGVEKFIYISTDKAVNPTSIMGATKKIGEIIIQDIALKNNTRFSCVRFGNVLGSRGSVVPFFQKQIANGGPITVTHPEIKRFFMSISEAVSLIIQAGTIGDKGEIFVLDMGQPIKIMDLAKGLIRLSGHKEDDIEIKFIGLRPGEKLYEEILIDEERVKATQYEKLFIAPPIEIDTEKFHDKLMSLIKAAKECNDRKIIINLQDIEIGYHGDDKALNRS